MQIASTIVSCKGRESHHYAYHGAYHSYCAVIYRIFSAQINSRTQTRYSEELTLNIA